MNAITSKNQLYTFSQIAMRLFSEILTAYGREQEINIFPVMPNSLAIELGRIYMPKINNDLIIYDQIKNDKFNGFERH